MSTGTSNIGYTAKLHDHCVASIINAQLFIINYKGRHMKSRAEIPPARSAAFINY